MNQFIIFFSFYNDSIYHGSSFFLLKCITEKYREAHKDFHMVLLTWRKHMIQNLERLCTYVVSFRKECCAKVYSRQSKAKGDLKAPLGSFNRGNEKFIPLFRSLSEREQNGQEGTLIPLYSLKTSNFHSPRNQEEWEEMKLDLMIFLVKLPKYPYMFNPLF